MKYFADLLVEEEKKVRKALSKMEDLSGSQSLDVRLMLQHQGRLKHKLTSLNLDPADTDGKELYEALKVKLAKDFELVAKSWGVREDNVTSKVIEVCNQCADANPVLSIKCSSMKRLLKPAPPKNVMKFLNYRSLDSMLKREDARVLVALAFKLETPQWNSRLASKVSRLKSSDYELRNIEIFDLSAPKFVNIKSQTKPVSYVSLMGAVILAPAQCSPAQSPGLVLLCLKAKELAQMESKYLSSNQFKADFGKSAARLFIGFEPTAVTIGDYPILSSLDAMRMLNGTESSAYQKFTRLHPALFWWHDTASLAQRERSAPVSLNLSDIAACLAGNLGYAERYFHNFISEMKNVIVAKYAETESVKNYFADQIDDSLIALEELTQGARAVPQEEEIYI